MRGYRHGVQRVQHADICVHQERQQGRGVCRGQRAKTGRHHYEVRLSNAAMPQCLFCWIDLTHPNNRSHRSTQGEEEKRREEKRQLAYRFDDTFASCDLVNLIMYSISATFCRFHCTWLTVAHTPVEPPALLSPFPYQHT